MSFYLGLDLSLTGTGIVVLNKDSEVVYAKTVKNDLTGPARLVFIRNEIASVLEDCTPTKVCIENYAMGIRSGQSFSIGELGGVVRTLLYQHGYEFLLASPTQLKKFITGKGVAEKDVIMLSVYKNFGYEPKDNNIADAYGLAKIALHTDIGIEGLLSYQKEVVEGVLNTPESGKKAKKPKKEKKAKGVKLQRRGHAQTS